MKFQAQAVLRRADMLAPLRLVGVLLAGSFYPGSTQDAWGPLHLEVGLVALAPLDPVIEDMPDVAAGVALAEARSLWSDDTLKGATSVLEWHPIRDVRRPIDPQSVAELIEQMSTANAIRTAATPSTPPYHAAARDLERLAGIMFDTTSSEERTAEDGAFQRGDPHPALPDGSVVGGTPRVRPRDD